MSLGMFMLGAVIMATGILAVWKTTFFVTNFGDLGEMLGFMGVQWLSWKVAGVFLIILGFLLAFNLLGLFFNVIFGQLFYLGGGV